MNSWIDVGALWKIVVFGLVAGAGLPALFAVGLRALSPAEGRTQDTSARRAFGLLCFALVLIAIGYGLYLVVSSS